MKKYLKAIKSIKLKNFLWLALGMIFLINIAVISQNKSIVAGKKAVADEIARPANISITIIKDSSCTDCAELTNYIDAVKKQNVKVISEEVLDTFKATPEQAAKISKLRDEFNIQKIPTFTITGELTKSDGLKNLLSAMGEIKNNTFKFTLPVAPYVDYSRSGHIAGIVELTLISDKSCAECQNAQIYKQILARFDLLKFSPETDLDRSDTEAKTLIKKYKITALPTFILSGEVSEYASLVNTWAQVGTVEKDGAYVFRELKVTGLTYSDLKTGKIVKPGTTTPAPAPSPSPKPTPK